MIEDLAAAAAGGTVAANLLVDRPVAEATLGLVGTAGENVDEAEAVLERVGGRLAQLGVKVVVEDLDTKPVAETVLEVARRAEAGAIVLAPPHHSVLQRLREASLLHQLLRHSSIPIVVAPHPGAAVDG